MSNKRGLPTGITMRHDAHYVEELARSNRTDRTIGRIIPINQIEPNPEQPRVEIGDLSELTSSIKEKGVLEPLLVKPLKETGSWMIIAGERRWRAANLAGLREVPCVELDIDEQSIAEIALIENLQRKDLTVWEEADGLADLATRYAYTHDEISKKIGKSRSTVTEAIAIAGLPSDIRKRCLGAKIMSKSTLLEISRQFDESAMHELLNNIQNNNLKRQEIRQAARPQIKKALDKDFQPLSREVTVQKSSKTNDLSISQKNFVYVSRSKDFTLRIEFNSGSYNEQDILKALKEASESLQQ